MPMPSSYMHPDVAEELLYIDHDEDDKQKVLLKKNSLGSAKQISVDPISLRQSSSQIQMVAASKVELMMIPPLPPSKHNILLSQSLPNSASSSPRSKSKKKKNKSSKDDHGSKLKSSLSVLHRQDSIALSNLERLRELHLQRSKSCGEGRTSAIPQDFGRWVAKDDAHAHLKRQSNHNTYIEENNNNYYKVIEAKIDDDEEDNSNYKPHGKENKDAYDEKFKCRALCLHLPSFGGSKAKMVKSRRQGSDIMSSQLKEGSAAATQPPPPPPPPAAAAITTMGHVVSKRVSLEKFECDNNEDEYDDDEEGDASDRFFDLPLEMIKCSSNDDDDDTIHSPVTTAFVFDKEPKGVLKNSHGHGHPRKSTTTESSSGVRHVRFSTSSQPASPTTSCVTPRQRKARDDFNAFLAAQIV